MILGATLLKGNGDAYYSPSFPRGSMTGNFRVQATSKWGTSPTLDIDIEHRNADETSFVSAGTFTQITTTGSHSKTQSALKEIVRLKYVIGGTEAYAGWHFLVLAPQWVPD